MTEPGPRLAELDEAGLRRRLRTISSGQGPHVCLDGHRVLLLCSNNYLGLTHHPGVVAASSKAAERWGTGAGSSRLISGTMDAHVGLEGDLAEFHGYPEALVFGSGYLANLGTISALAGPGEIVCSDELNHASIVDGCRLSGAEKLIYRHNDHEHLRWLLKSAGGKAALIVSDGIFSMDGDIADIAGLVTVARDSGAKLMIDDAHGVGTAGPGGRGTVAAAELIDEVDILVGTLGKSLASYGAYVCCDSSIRDLLINSSRSFIFSTALAPPALAAARAALEILSWQPKIVNRLAENAAALREGLAEHGVDTGPSRTQIVPVIIGDASEALAACERALEAGVFAQAIRPPTVAEGTSRLRMTVMADHKPAELRAAAAIVANALTGATAVAELPVVAADDAPAEAA